MLSLSNSCVPAPYSTAYAATSPAASSRPPCGSGLVAPPLHATLTRHDVPLPPTVTASGRPVTVLPPYSSDVSLSPASARVHVGRSATVVTTASLGSE